MPREFHVALSFAGEDRAYVDAVAEALKAEGVDVFYDKFEEADLWGKDLYTHLSEIYQNRAFFTVIFISDAYSKQAAELLGGFDGAGLEMPNEGTART